VSARAVKLRALAPAKVNLGLFVGPTRSDGRHRLVSVMQSISLADELTLEYLTRNPPPADRSGCSPDDRVGVDVLAADVAADVVCPDVPELAGPHNLAARALGAFRARTGWEPGPLRLTITKRVPIAAGLGGGSGDAAAALRLAARASGYDDPALLLELAGELGADVPAQVKPGRWLACGAGGSLQELPAPREPLGVLVLAHESGLSTAEVYAQFDRLGIQRDVAQLRDLAQQLAAALKDGRALPARELLSNDLEHAAALLEPSIERTLEQARQAGADIALVSGSGPTVLGLFSGPDGPQRAHAAAQALAWRDPAPLVAGPVLGASADVAAVRNNWPR
jgi:4-diphosphocytidyl-2-C-methyl-D-erythritol kinase